jgi:3-phenylpropionate/cinnamic acid dioxygenase small subunit
VVSVETRNTDSDDLRLLLALLSNYCRYLDEQRWTDLAALLTSDCTLHITGEVHSGPESIVTFLRRGARGKHMLSTPRIDFVSGDQAHLLTDQVFIRYPELAVVVAGSYEDVAVKTAPGTWQLQRRTVVMHAAPADLRSVIRE